MWEVTGVRCRKTRKQNVHWVLSPKFFGFAGWRFYAWLAGVCSWLSGILPGWLKSRWLAENLSWLTFQKDFGHIEELANDNPLGTREQDNDLSWSLCRTHVRGDGVESTAPAVELWSCSGMLNGCH